MQRLQRLPLRVRAAVDAALAESRKPVGIKFVLGRCLPSVKHNAAKIRVSQLHLDERINMVSAFASIECDHFHEMLN